MSPKTQECKDEVSRILARDAYSASLHTAGGQRADGAQLGSNNPCEDRFNRFQPLRLWDSQTWIAASIFDGHNGWQTADHLEKVLLTVVQSRLNKLQPESRNDIAIQNTIEESFTDIDDSLIRDFVSRATDKDLALEEKIHWLAVPLSEDQNCDNEKETARIREEHPNEQKIIQHGKVLGMGVTRAFGNFRWKASYELQLDLGKRFSTARPRNQDDIPTPPYLTAKPIVTVKKLEAELPAFVILASDGLWYNCESGEAVDLVVRWLESQPKKSLEEIYFELKETPNTVWWKSEPQQEANYAPGFDFLARWNNVDIRFREERTTIEDLDNVAVHLLRNALGGSHREIAIHNERRFTKLQDKAARILSQDACSASFNAAGIGRADSAQLPSNSPCEDRFNRVRSLHLWLYETWAAAAIFDGHNGWQTAELLQQELLNGVQKRLNELDPPSRNDEMIQRAIESSFMEFDDSIIQNYIAQAKNNDISLDEKIHTMEVAMSGSCALLILYNPSTKTLYTACTGDSRAVLGHQISNGMWEPVALSEDQKGINEAEMARLRQEHPGEESVIKNGKVLGMSVTRAFGDFPWKASYDMQLEFGRRFYTHGPMGKDEILTPPYLTAKPVSTVNKLEEKSPSFLVLTSDGLWDMCDNDEVVDLVVRWLDAQPESNVKSMWPEFKTTPETVWWKRIAQTEPQYASGFDFLERFERELYVGFFQARTTIQDLDNVSVHLLRNACGGNHQQLLEGKLAFRPPYSRNVRDDITVQVLFF
ncbi:hypothetical protein PWT90_03849 [Aphanocladium album]|nr:hypothetical protein PWT90_03849 [Aphanocladium album]